MVSFWRSLIGPVGPRERDSWMNVWTALSRKVVVEYSKGGT